MAYSVKILEASTELTTHEKIKLKNTSDSQPLDGATMEGEVIITPEFWVILDVTNDKSNDKNYTNYVIADKDGQKYRTGSESFWNAFKDIWDELEEAGELETDWEIRVYRLPSKNRTGKDFLTCSLV